MAVFEPYGPFVIPANKTVASSKLIEIGMLPNIGSHMEEMNYENRDAFI